MKTRSLCATALAGVLLFSAIGGGMTASAAATDYTSNGKVKITEGKGGDGPNVDPENPDTPLPKPDVPPLNPDKGPLMVERVAPMDFGQIETGAIERKQYASLNDMGNGMMRGNYVVFSDVRAGKQGYTLQAKMAKQFTAVKNVQSGKPIYDASKTLKNSTITFSNALVDPTKGNGNTAPEVVANTFSLDETGTAVDVVSASALPGDKTVGKGQYTLAFGRSDSYNGTNGVAGTAKESVQLTIPTSTASTMEIGDYQAEVLWTIVAK